MRSAVEEATRLAEQYGFGDKLGKRAFTLSGGERQRVAIVRTLMMKPEFILLDEITSALDPVLVVDMMNTIKRLRDQGQTMILVTHHIEFATQLCDRLMFLSKGQIVQVDSPPVLRRNPATPEVGRFLETLTYAR